MLADMLLLLLSLLSVDAHAAGYYTSDVGVRAFSRGGAYVAGANDMLALWYNPAALTRLQDGMVTVDLAGVAQDVYFDRKDYPGEGPEQGNYGDGDYADLITPPIENSAPPFPIPHMGAAWNFGLKDTVFAVGFYPPYAPDLSYPADGPQRYTLIDTLIIQTFTGASVAHRLWDRLSIGGGLSWNYLRVEQELAVNVPWVLPGETDMSQLTINEDPKYDVGFRLDGRDQSGLGWNVGLLYEPPSNRYAFGFMYQAPVKFSATGIMEADFSQNFFRTDDVLGIVTEDRVRDDQVRFDVSMPPIVKVGGLFRPMPTMEVELAAVWEGWSVIDVIRIYDVNMTVPVDQESAIVSAAGVENIEITDDIYLPAGYTDTWSVRLGGEWQFHKKGTLRMGGLWEQGAIPSANRNVSLLDGTKWGYGLGATWQAWKRVGFDMGWFQSVVKRTTIEDSSVKSIVLHWESGQVVDGRNVGDGVLGGSAKMLGVGVNYAFGKDPEGTRQLGHAQR